MNTAVVWLLVLVSGHTITTPVASFSTQVACEANRADIRKYTKDSDAPSLFVQCVPIHGTGRVRLPN